MPVVAFATAGEDAERRRRDLDVVLALPRGADRCARMARDGRRSGNETGLCDRVADDRWPSRAIGELDLRPFEPVVLGQGIAKIAGCHQGDQLGSKLADFRVSLVREPIRPDVGRPNPETVVDADVVGQTWIVDLFNGRPMPVRDDLRGDVQRDEPHDDRLA